VLVGFTVMNVFLDFFIEFFETDHLE